MFSIYNRFGHLFYCCRTYKLQWRSLYFRCCILHDDKIFCLFVRFDSVRNLLSHIDEQQAAQNDDGGGNGSNRRSRTSTSGAAKLAVARSIARHERRRILWHVEVLRGGASWRKVDACWRTTRFVSSTIGASNCRRHRRRRAIGRLRSCSRVSKTFGVVAAAVRRCKRGQIGGALYFFFFCSSSQRCVFLLAALQKSK